MAAPNAIPTPIPIAIPTAILSKATPSATPTPTPIAIPAPNFEVDGDLLSGSLLSLSIKVPLPDEFICLKWGWDHAKV
jgi:hypothetical protein